MIVSIFHCDKFVYHYPNSKEQLSEDLKNNFSQGFPFGLYTVEDNLKTKNSFKLGFSGKNATEIQASVTPLTSGLQIEIEIDANPLFMIIFIWVFGILFSIHNGSIQLWYLMFPTIFTLFLGTINYFFKIKLKKDFETKLKLPHNEECVKRRFKYF